jgi:hypothetical protein
MSIYRNRFDELNDRTNAYRATCVDRFNPSTRANYEVINASGSRQNGYYHSCTPIYSNKPTTKGRYLGNGQYVED